MSNTEIIEIVNKKMIENNIVGLKHLFELDDYYVAIGDKERNGYSCNCLMINKKDMNCEKWQPYLKEHIEMLNNAKDLL